MSRRHLTKCPTAGKTRFRDKREAEEVLHNAEAARRWCESEGLASRRRECRSYFCAECKGWHITSQERKFWAQLSVAT